MTQSLTKTTTARATHGVLVLPTCMRWWRWKEELNPRLNIERKHLCGGTYRILTNSLTKKIYDGTCLMFLPVSRRRHERNFDNDIERLFANESIGIYILPSQFNRLPRTESLKHRQCQTVHKYWWYLYKSNPPRLLISSNISSDPYSLVPVDQLLLHRALLCRHMPILSTLAVLLSRHPRKPSRRLNT